ncbi:MAG: hypothetical protein U0525_04305 [Patescibacteria group bacterium]
MILIIYQSVLSSYREIVGYLSIGKSEQWQRPLPVDLDTALTRIEGIPYLTADTKLQLMFALSNMKSSVLRRNALVNIENRDLTTHVMPMAGPCYSTSICEIGGDVIMGIRPYIFSDLGGAGVGMPYGIVTKIKKGGGVLNDDEMQARRDFQSGFIKYAKLCD